MKVKVSQLRKIVAEVVAEATAKMAVPPPKPGAKASRELPTDVEFNYGPPAASCRGVQGGQGAQALPRADAQP